MITIKLTQIKSLHCSQSGNYAIVVNTEADYEAIHKALDKAQIYHTACFERLAITFKPLILIIE